MSCNICDKFPLKRVQSIDKHLLDGKRSLMAIADHYQVDMSDLRMHLTTCVQGQMVPSEDAELLQSQQLLQTIILQLQDDVAKGRHLEFDPESGIDGRSIFSNLLQAMREHRETVVTRNKIRTSEEIYSGLQENVLTPFISTVTKICIDESRKTRDELFGITKHHEDLHPKIKKAIDEMLERIADRMSTEAVSDAPERVKAVLDAKKQKQPSATKH